MTNITQRQRSWLKDNFIGLILVAMVAAYFAYDLQDKESNRSEHRQFNKDITDLKAITFNLVEAYGGKMAKDQEQDMKLSKQDKEILELWKIQRRSGGKTDVSILNK